MRALPLFVLVGGCSRPVEAPAEVEALASYLFTEWDADDPRVMEAGVANLLSLAEGLDLSGEVEDRSFVVVGGLDRAEVEPFVVHDHDPADTDAVGIFYLSPHPVEAHLLHIALTDRTPVEPSSPDLYAREWISGDPDCLWSAACETINAMNDVERKNFLYELRYDLDKYWRLVQTPEGDRALAARSLNVDETDNGGNIRLLQGYSIDVFAPWGEGSLRFQVAWQRTELPGLDDDDMSGAIADGIEGAFLVMDDWLTANR